MTWALISEMVKKYVKAFFVWGKQHLQTSFLKLRGLVSLLDGLFRAITSFIFFSIVFGAMCIQYELYWFGAGIICINLFLIFYMVTLVDLAIHHAHPDEHVPQWRRALPTFRKTRPQENETAV